MVLEVLTTQVRWDIAALVLILEQLAILSFAIGG